MKRQELKEQKEFCSMIVNIARDVCASSNLCQITEEGCRRYNFKDEPSLCCMHCEHIEIGKGCKTECLSCSTGVCYYGWIQADYVDPRAIEFFGEEHRATLYKLAFLRKIVYDKLGPMMYWRLSIKQSFSKNREKYVENAKKRYFKRSNIKSK